MAWAYFTDSVQNSVGMWSSANPATIATIRTGTNLGNVSATPATGIFELKQYTSSTNISLNGGRIEVTVNSTLGRRVSIYSGDTQLGFPNRNANDLYQGICFVYDDETEEMTYCIMGKQATATYAMPALLDTTMKKMLYTVMMGNVDVLHIWHNIPSVVGVDSTLSLMTLTDYILEDSNVSNGATVESAIVTSWSGNARNIFYHNDSEQHLLVRTYEKELNPYEKDEMSIYARQESGACWLDFVYKVGENNVTFSRQFKPYDGVLDINNAYLGFAVDYENEEAVALCNQYTRGVQSTVSFGGSPTTDTSSSTLNHFLYLILFGNPRESDEDDTLYDLPDATPDTGKGEKDYKDEVLKDTPAPANIASEIGFITLFTPTTGDLKSLATYMWNNDLFDIDTYKKLFANPMECILSLMKLPVHVEASRTQPLTVGNMSTGFNFNIVTKQIFDKEMGFCHIPAQLGSFLDYAPFTSAFIYLPFCGTFPLDVDKIVDRDVYITYRIDSLSGACIAKIMLDSADGDIIAQHTGNMGYMIPLTSSDNSRMMSAILNVGITGAGIGASVMSGGAGAVAGGLGATVASTAQNVANMKPIINKGSSTGSNLGVCSTLTPYIMFTSPDLVYSKDKDSMLGIPTGVARKLSSVTGFTQIQSAHVASSRATADEVTEIENLLKEGVIL